MLGLTMRTASLVGTSVSSTSTNSRGTRYWTFAFYRLESGSAFFFTRFSRKLSHDCGLAWEGKASSEKKNRNRDAFRGPCECHRFRLMEETRRRWCESLEFAFVLWTMDLECAGVARTAAWFSLSSWVLFPVNEKTYKNLLYPFLSNAICIRFFLYSPSSLFPFLIHSELS